MDAIIRKLKIEEYPVLREFLYLSIFVPEGQSPPSFDILDTPEFRVYLDDYGHFYDGVPSLAISLLPECRGQGLGKRLLSGLLEQLRSAGYDRVTLSVQKENRAACKLYRDLGFCPVHENHEEFIMLKTLT